MTANRWWVKMAARWQARIDAIQGQIQAISLLATGFSTFSIMLQGFGKGEWVPYLGALVAISLPIYAFLYFEGGVWNQVGRDRADKSSNFSAPAGRIIVEMYARSREAARRGRPLSEEERDAIKAEADAAFLEFRDGYDIDQHDTDQQEATR
ncbi:hypothetical protein HWV23_02790 [Natronomonas halophila]|uniref:hypothetical protein n=1 Tax=Natronomonas halophila TaxID=2747817 RepID=UPI0015B5371D|nr:hypothetical protein [Natronomonas halophila]QLD84629.1 hypothetical protein HWV23_02515 [Natronomonas halophila]QLD84683.1 hypothetical protein HWV23_02790 [Natronomonas halophila]